MKGHINGNYRNRFVGNRRGRNRRERRDRRCTRCKHLMDADEFREKLVDLVTRIIVEHQLPDYGERCSACYKHLYNQDGGSTLSRHRAEKIVDGMELVKALNDRVDLM
jgi:hypothetical protein